MSGRNSSEKSWTRDASSPPFRSDTQAAVSTPEPRTMRCKQYTQSQAQGKQANARTTSENEPVGHRGPGPCCARSRGSLPRQRSCHRCSVYWRWSRRDWMLWMCMGLIFLFDPNIQTRKCCAQGLATAAAACPLRTRKSCQNRQKHRHRLHLQLPAGMFCWIGSNSSTQV